MNRHTKLSSLALPLALVFALAQGGSCGRGAQGGKAASGGVAGVQNANAKHNANANMNANTNVNRNASVHVNIRNANVNARDNANDNANDNAGAGAGANANMSTDREGDENDSGAGDDAVAGGLAAGSWGGRGVSLNVDADGARVEFDCAHGRMGKLSLGAGGAFEAAGVFVAERGGPSQINEKENERSARYSGKVAGKTMTLSVTLEGASASPLTFTLTRGRTGRLAKCL